MLMFVCAGTCTICSCSKDNGENLDIHVIVNEDGTTSNGSIFSAIDNQNFYVDYIKYTVTDYYLSVSGYDKTKFNGVAKIISKLTYKGHTFEVLEIGDYAFNYCSGLTSVTIPNSVTRIGVEAFDGCTGLTSVTIPNSVTSIDKNAFRGSGLTSVHITDLAAWCKIDFYDYDSNPLTCAHHLYLNGQEIKDLVIPNSVTSIGEYAFYGCTGLTSITIPNSVTSIGSSSFYLCTGLTSVTIGNSVTSIGDYAFRGCTGLTSVTIGNSVTSIGYRAFEYCSGLTSITIPNSVTSIGGSAFEDCYIQKNKFINNSALTSAKNWGATLFDDETDEGLLITDHVVVRCRPWVTSANIPNSVTSIGYRAFYGCTGLTSITIPNSVTSIGGSAFLGCSGLTDVWCYAEEHPYIWDAFNGSSISTATLHVPAASLEEYRAYAPWEHFGQIVAL